MKISMIAAIDADAGLARDGKIPWPWLRQDMTFFRKKTVGTGNGAVIMGRKTWSTLPKKPLPDRLNVVLTRTPTQCQGAIVVASIEAAVDIVRGKDAFVIGGGEIYRQMLAHVDSVFLTRIGERYQCDVTFPLDQLKTDFVPQLVQSYTADEAENLPAFRIEHWKCLWQEGWI